MILFKQVLASITGILYQLGITIHKIFRQREDIRMIVEWICFCSFTEPGFAIIDILVGANDTETDQILATVVFCHKFPCQIIQ